VIRRLIGEVDASRMTRHLFHLAKDPLPFRKLNLTLPGHDKSTLDEADVSRLTPIRPARIMGSGVEGRRLVCGKG